MRLGLMAAAAIALLATAAGGAIPAGRRGPAPASPAAAAPMIAFTVDDLPAHGPLPPGVTRMDVVRAFIAALHSHHVPAFGFVNGGFGLDDPQSPAVLAAWRAAGFPLGNHTFHHLGLSQTPLADWQADVVANEAVIAPLMKGADWHWLRYPFLDEGKPEAREAARAFLRGRGYRIAGVSMGFGDYLWNDPYARCAAKGDAGAITALERSYLEAARADALRTRARAMATQGHEVPYVLLMHLGAFDAHMLPRLLDLYDRLGFRYVPLATAEADPFWRGAIDLTRPGPSPTLPAQVGEPALPQPDPALCR